MSNQQLQQMPVVWLQGASCSGCSVSLLNSAAPRIANVLLEELVPGKHVQVVFHPTIMAASGQVALEILHDTEQRSDGYVLILEGGLPEKIPYIGGTTDDGEEISILDCFADLAANAIAVVAVGSCAAFGGVPAAAPNPSGCKTASEVLTERGVATPVVNVSGCPPHPDWIVGTLVHLMLNGVPEPDDLDDWGRPRAFFGGLIHENCPRRADFDAGKFATHHGKPGCLYELGCKGPLTYSDCPLRQWNSGISWPIGAGSPCLGCVEPGFPDVGSGLYEKISACQLPRLEADPDTGRLRYVAPWLNRSEAHECQGQ